MSLECVEGLRPHNSGTNYKVEKKFSDCGIADYTENKKCAKSKSCAVVDVWIKGINDRPLTIPSCGLEEKKDRGCEAICDKKAVDDWKTTLTERLKKYAKESEKLTEECLKMLTDIEAISSADCSKEKCNDRYCKGIKSIPGKDCQKIPPKTTKAPVENESSTQKVAPPMTSVPDTNSNTTGNATTSGQAKNIDNVTYIVFLVLAILFNFLH